MLTVTSFLTPPSLWLADAGNGHGERDHAASRPKFDASNLVAEQREAVSSDGTKIPYFLVHRKDMKLDGNNPTLLYAYGGFEVSETPNYSATTGKLWLEKGGVYALANIRGGGEFGPAWHEAGLGTKRQIIYDDFAAVAKDLIATKVTSPRRLGIRGGSNGGLLMGVEFTQHPELWNAVDHRGAAARHDPHLEDRRRRVVGRRIWQRRERSRRARLLDQASALAREEIFGPVLSVLRFSDEDEVVAKVNDSAYGLSAYLHTRDVARAHRLAQRFEVGSVVVNAFPSGSPTAPFGGVKASGFGREGGRGGLDEFLRPKNVFIGF